jgi:hypothetical protein
MYTYVYDIYICTHICMICISYMHGHKSGSRAYKSLRNRDIRKFREGSCNTHLVTGLEEEGRVLSVAGGDRNRERRIGSRERKRAQDLVSPQAQGRMPTHDQASHHHGCLARTSPGRTRGRNQLKSGRKGKKGTEGKEGTDEGKEGEDSKGSAAKRCCTS